MTTPISGEMAAQRLHALLIDFELDVAGVRRGLTMAELQRAWRARHGDPMPFTAMNHVYARHGCRVLGRRNCDVTGHFRHAILPLGGK